MSSLPAGILVILEYGPPLSGTARNPATSSIPSPVPPTTRDSGPKKTSYRKPQVRPPPIRVRSGDPVICHPIILLESRQSPWQPPRVRRILHPDSGARPDMARGGRLGWSGSAPPVWVAGGSLILARPRPINSYHLWASPAGSPEGTARRRAGEREAPVCDLLEGGDCRPRRPAGLQRCWSGQRQGMLGPTDV